MKFAVLSYLRATNLGDEIQSIAARGLMPRVDVEIARENLKEFRSTEKHVLLMNGWFTHDPPNEFPPADDIIPIYYGFHITPNAGEFFTSAECVAHFKKWQPIGCRDRGTMELLRNAGIDAFYSKCLTLTFPKRSVEPVNGKTFLVDVPGSYKKFGDVVRITHEHKLDGTERKSVRAQELLDRYRDEAKLVVTSRLHCALPCQAMGIPVIFVMHTIQREYRVSIYIDLGGVIYRSAYREIFRCIWESRYTKLSRIFQDCEFGDFLSSRRWQEDVLDVENTARKIRQDISAAVNKYVEC